jgi:hypothetical protein
MTFKLLCLGAAAALVIAPAAFAQPAGGASPGGTMANPGGSMSGPAPTVDTPTNPAPQAAPTPVGPAQSTTDPSANVGSAANANATVGGATDNGSGTTKKKAKHGSVNGSQPAAPTATPAPNSATGAPQ